MADPYEELKNHFGEVEEVTVASGRGAQGLKVGKKMFAMFYKGDLLVQLSPERVAEVITSGEGEAYDPGTGTPMRNRVLIPSARKDRWVAFWKESLNFVTGRE